jgi:hypothetical protein
VLVRSQSERFDVEGSRALRVPGWDADEVELADHGSSRIVVGMLFGEA